MPSILSEPYARELWTLLDNQRHSEHWWMPVDICTPHIDLSARWAYRRRQDGRSGGAIIWANLHPPKYGGPPKRYAVRVRGEHDAERFVRVATHLFDIAHGDLRRQLYAENVYALVNGSVIEESLREPIEAEAERTGRTLVYADMSSEDAVYWREWIEAARDRRKENGDA